MMSWERPGIGPQKRSLFQGIHLDGGQEGCIIDNKDVFVFTASQEMMALLIPNQSQRNTGDARRSVQARGGSVGEKGCTRCHHVCKANPISRGLEMALSGFKEGDYMGMARWAGREGEANLGGRFGRDLRSQISDLKLQMGGRGMEGRGRTSEDRGPRQRPDGAKQSQFVQAGDGRPEAGGGRADGGGRRTDGAKQSQSACDWRRSGKGLPGGGVAGMLSGSFRSWVGDNVNLLSIGYM